MLNPLANRRPITRRTRFLSLGVLVPASILVAGLQVGAQTARITGTVVDQAGHVVQNPGLALTNRATAEQLRVTGDDAGRFEFTDLEPAVSTVLAGRRRADRRRAGAPARLRRGDHRGDGHG